MLFDLIKHLRDQNRKQKIAFALIVAGLTSAFATGVLILNAYWLRAVLGLIAA